MLVCLYILNQTNCLDSLMLNVIMCVSNSLENKGKYDNIIRFICTNEPYNKYYHIFLVHHM